MKAHSLFTSQLDAVIGRLNAQAALQLLKIPRYGLRSGWARVGIFLDDLEKKTASSPAENQSLVSRTFRPYRDYRTD